MTNTTPIFKSETGRQAILAVYNSILERWPVPYQTGLLPTRTGDTFYIACGAESAPPLILIHGSSSNSAMWIGDCVAFALNHRVYALDIPGEPGKSQVTRASLDDNSCADWLEDCLHGLNLSQSALVGISLGGWMAVKFASTFPERVSTLVLLCPAGIAKQKTSFLYKAVPLMFLGDWGIDQLTRMVNGKQDIAQEAVDYTRLIAKNFNPRLNVIPVFPDAALQRLTMPVLLIVGEQDALLDSRQSAERFRRLVPQAQILHLPDMGHVLVNQHRLILPFINQV